MIVIYVGTLAEVINEGFMDKVKQVGQNAVSKFKNRNFKPTVTTTKREINYDQIPPAVRAKLAAQGVHD